MLQHLFFTIDLQPRTLLRCFVKLFVKFPHGGLPLWKKAEKECFFRALSESYNPPSIPPILPFLWTPKNIFHVLSASLLPQRDLIIDLFLSHLSIFLASLSKLRILLQNCSIFRFRPSVRHNCDMSIYAYIYRFWALVPVHIMFSNQTRPDFRLQTSDFCIVIIVVCTIKLISKVLFRPNNALGPCKRRLLNLKRRSQRRQTRFTSMRWHFHYFNSFFDPFHHLNSVLRVANIMMWPLWLQVKCGSVRKSISINCY